MLKAVDYANFFIDLSNSSEDDLISNLRLNKLLYFAQGCSFAMFDKPLFNEEIEAWQYGPVVPEVYKSFKPCGRNNIEETCGEYSPYQFSDEEMEVLLNVVEKYGKYSSPALVDITHQKNSPWSNVYEEGKLHIEIPKESIRNYFRNKMNLKPFNYEALKSMDEAGYRSEEGLYVLPKEFDDD